MRARLIRVVVFAALTTSAACGGRGVKPLADASADDGGRDVPGAEVLGVDAAPDRADAAPDRVDATPDHAAPDRTNSIDTAGPPEPTCVNRPGAAPACGEAMCGNGKRDNCAVKACSDGTISFPSEACDGTDLAGVTCVGDGYGSGVMTCSSTCTLDRSGCRTCMPVDTVLLACDDAAGLPVPGVGDVQIAATNTSAALAWYVGDSSTRTTTLSIARVSPTLEVLGVTTLENEPWPAGGYRTFTDVSIVPLGTGWLVGALAEEERVILHAVDAMGKDLGRVTLETLTTDEDYIDRFVTLVARPTGGAVVLWSANDRIRMAPVAADGQIGARTDYPLVGAVNVFASKAAWLGDAAYLVHTITSVDTWQSKTVLVRFAVDGTAPRVVTTLVNAATASLALAADADELLFSYGGPSPNGNPDDSAWLFARFDAQGRTTAAPFVTTDRSEAVIPAANDDVLLVSNSAADRSLNVERRSRAGAAAGPRRTIYKLPSGATPGDYTAARRGTEIIVAWSGYTIGKSRINLARLAQ